MRQRAGCPTSGSQLIPFCERRVATLFKVGSATEVTVEVEVVVDGGLNGDEFLQSCRASETLHGPFPSSKRLMGVLGTIVQPSRGVLPAADTQHCQGSR